MQEVVNLVHNKVVVEIDEEHVDAGRACLERCVLDSMAEVLGSDAPV